ncbi:hypothetical protein HZC27_01860 [Candidatus Roizmanbacteria bacterium]|nr:hypothetical protein [Candidatus Roizmanbacteria bacterium]
MLRPIFDGYTGKMEEGSFVGYRGGSGFFCILEVLGGYSEVQGNALIEHISQTVISVNPSNLKEFDEALNSLIQSADLPIEFSLSAGYFTSQVLYLKTVGTGEIYIKRGAHFERIIQGDTTASGHIQEHDIFIFSTSLFMEGTRGIEILKSLLHHKRQPTVIVESLKEVEGDKEETGTVLFVSFVKPLEEVNTAIEEPGFEVQPPPQQVIEKPSATPSMLVTKLTLYFRDNQKKRILLVGVILIFVILLLNMGNMFGKKQQEVSKKGVDSVGQKIEADLKAIDMSGDMERSLGIISQSRQSLDELKKTDKKLKSTDVKKLEDLITDYESKVIRREDKQTAEFYDLALEEKDSKADKMYLSDGKVSLLNREGKIYVFSLDNKSVEKKVYGEIANAGSIASFDKAVYFYKQGAGIYKINDKEKPARIIEDDPAWGNIIDLNVYNGNIYLLDSGKDEVYKYLVAEKGYSEKNSYMKPGSTLQLKRANSLAIDSSLYIGFDTFIAKYIAGVKDSFTIKYPESDISLVKIYTNKDLDNIYGLDKSKGTLYIFGKDGQYIKQIRSSDLNKTDDFVVYKNSVYLLNQTKILKIDL